MATETLIRPVEACDPINPSPSAAVINRNNLHLAILNSLIPDEKENPNPPTREIILMRSGFHNELISASDIQNSAELSQDTRARIRETMLGKMNKADRVIVQSPSSPSKIKL